MEGVFKLKLKVVVNSPKEKTQEEKSRLGRRSKNKGSTFERTIASKFKEAYSVDLVRTPQSGGFAKKSEKADDFRGDITSADKDVILNLHIECKCQKSWALPSWIRQAEEDCPKSKIPAVIFHQHGTSKDYVCISLTDFFKLVPEENIIEKKQVYLCGQ